MAHWHAKNCRRQSSFSRLKGCFYRFFTGCVYRFSKWFDFLWNLSKKMTWLSMKDTTVCTLTDFHLKLAVAFALDSLTALVVWVRCGVVDFNRYVYLHLHLHSIWMNKAWWTLSLPQTSRANPVQCYSTHQEKCTCTCTWLSMKVFQLCAALAVCVRCGFVDFSR